MESGLTEAEFSPEQQLTDFGTSGLAHQQNLSNPEAIEKLSRGLANSCVTEQENIKKLLSDVSEIQRVILETLQQENAKFTECQIMKEIICTMDEAKVYQAKLVNIKKEMFALHDKAKELKRRAVRIQQEKQKEALIREQQRERELERELKLTARLARPI